jgi:hypothetical protein
LEQGAGRERWRGNFLVGFWQLGGEGVEIFGDLILWSRFELRIEASVGFFCFRVLLNKNENDLDFGSDHLFGS